MIISTRGRYALRVMLDIAKNEKSAGGYVSMKSVVLREGVSKKYMEQIMPVLVKNGLLKGVHGKGGGYRLTRKPEDYTILEILRLTEGDLAPVACVNGDGGCERADTCATLPMWKEFYALINDFFNKKTLKDLMTGDENKN